MKKFENSKNYPEGRFSWTLSHIYININICTQTLHVCAHIDWDGSKLQKN